MDSQDKKLVDTKAHGRQFLRFEDTTRQFYSMNNPRKCQQQTHHNLSLGGPNRLKSNMASTDDVPSRHE